MNKPYCMMLLIRKFKISLITSNKKRVFLQIFNSLKMISYFSNKYVEVDKEKYVLATIKRASKW